MTSIASDPQARIICGTLELFFEQGMEYNAWRLYEDNPPSTVISFLPNGIPVYAGDRHQNPYAGLHPLQDDDLLVTFEKNTRGLEQVDHRAFDEFLQNGADALVDPDLAKQFLFASKLSYDLECNKEDLSNSSSLNGLGIHLPKGSIVQRMHGCTVRGIPTGIDQELWWEAMTGGYPALLVKTLHLGN